MSDGSELRASDEQRERTAADLREHFAAGRLSDDELGERLDAVYGARTEGELRELCADLPALCAPPAQTRAAIAQRRSMLQREMIQQTGGGLVPFLVYSVIWVSTNPHGAFWPAWVALAVLIPLLRGGWLLYGPAPELDRVEAQLARHRERRDRQARRHDRRRLGS